ncbi:MAG TPA: OmpA family protein [Planctomycetota bacterium]|nr:OmpA family protein [Planctomycetota bacterium]
MSSKLTLAFVGAVLSLTSIGCAGRYVNKEEYDRDITQTRELNDALMKENAELRLKGDAYDRLKNEMEINGESAKFYNELADSLKKALAGMGIAEHEVTIEKDGRVVFATDVLFDLGSWTLTAKGHQILSAFAQTQKGNVMKIVGHTDRKPIVSAKLTKALETDTNKELSVKRAVAVMGELLKSGIRESQIASVEGHGSDEPRGNDAKSRRVEIFILPGAHVAPTSAVKPAKTVKK